jgi:hypothetical protein
MFQFVRVLHDLQNDEDQKKKLFYRVLLFVNHLLECDGYSLLHSLPNYIRRGPTTLHHRKRCCMCKTRNEAAA